MPIYEYRCASCGHQQEFLQKVSDAPLTVCPQCGKATFSKMVTAAGFQLKGSGWYATDFKNSGAKPAAKSTDTSKGETSKGETSKAETSKAEASKGDSSSSTESKSDGGDKKAAPPSSATR